MPIKENHDGHAPLSKQDIAWFEKLEGEIWIRREGSWPQEKRKLTGDEWEKIKDLIDTHRLPLVMHNSGFGFSIGISIHGTDPCKQLIFIDSHHLPQFDRKKYRAFEYGWKIFSPMTHDNRNREILRSFKIEKSMKKDHYDY
jgi:hypothetical protein